jgi:2-polyprenyl-3-methyl-5-hydroxy-6-metoxy-1,4-benzoquinol methylase
MIRSGIYNIGQLNTAGLKDIFRKEKNISIYLYQKINQIDNPEKRKQYAELILNRFNSDRNVLKRTYKNRFNNFDNLAIDVISQQNFENISVLDIAISDGRASCFFLEQ